MPFTVQDIIWSGVVPFLTALVVAMLLLRWLPGQVGQRHASSAPILVALLVGYGCSSLGPWAATAHWHWLPYVCIAAAVAGPVSAVADVSVWERLLLQAVIAAVAAWFIVPTWDDLEPSRSVYLIGFTVLAVALSAGLQPLETRLPGAVFPAVLWLCVSVASVVLLLSGSVRFAQIGLIGAAALFGIYLLTLFGFCRDSCSMLGGTYLFTLFTLGILLIGNVNSFSEVPLASYALVPAAPLALWFTVVGPLSCCNGAKANVVRVFLPASVLALSIVMALVAEANSGADY